MDPAQYEKVEHEKAICYKIKKIFEDMALAIYE